MDAKVRELEKFKVPYGGFIYAKPGDEVKKGQIVGCIHHLERPDRAPEEIVAQSAGYLITMRAPCLTQQGDCVAVIARQVSEREVLRA